MEMNEISRLRSALMEIKTDLSAIKDAAEKIKELIESDHLLPLEAAASLEEALCKYNEKAALLQQTGAGISLALEDTLSSLFAQLDDEEKRVSEQNLVIDFFRITADAEDIRKNLEDSKQRLAAILSRKDASADFSPYMLVAEKVKSRDALTETEFTTIQNGISLNIARAADRGNLTFDPAIDVEPYIAFDEETTSVQIKHPEDKSGSEDVLPSLEPTALNEGTSEAEEVRDEKAAGRLEKEPDTEKESEIPEQPQGIEPIVDPKWDVLDGFSDDVSVDYCDEPASSLGASKFVSQSKQRTDLPWAIHLLGIQKMYTANEKPDKEAHFEAARDDNKAFLEKQRFVMGVNVKKGDRCWDIVTLTSKGWACFTKPEVVSFMKSHKPSLVLPKYMRSSVAELMEGRNVLQLLVLHDFYTAKVPPVNYAVDFTAHKGMAAAYPLFDASPKKTIACAAVFNRGDQANGLQGIFDLISDEETLREVCIIAFSLEDIRKISAALNLTEKLSARVKYFLFPFDGNEYDGNGNKVVCAEAQESVEPESSIEAIEREQSKAERQALEDAEQKSFVANLEEKTEEKTQSQNQQYCRYQEEAGKLLVREKMPEAITMYKALTKYSDEGKQLYKQLAYAADDPSFSKSYCYSELQEVFSRQFGENYFYDACAVSAYLRMFFSEDILSEPFYLRNWTCLDGNSVFDDLESAKDLLYALKEQFLKTGHAFEPHVRKSLLSSSEQQNHAILYQRKAKADLSGRLEETNVNNARVKDTRATLFKKGSMLRGVLEIVGEGDKGKANLILDNLKEYLAVPYIPGEEYVPKMLSAEKVDGLVDAAWEQPAVSRNYRRSNERLTGIARNNITEKVKDVISTCLTWASLNDASQADDTLLQSHDILQSYREQAAKKFEDLISALSTLSNDGEKNAGRAILKYTCAELRKWLSEGRDYQRRDRFYFVDFLKWNFVELDENYFPFMESDFDDIMSFSLCKCIFDQSNAIECTWDDALKRILEDVTQGCDCGHARLIQEYLQVTDPEYVWPKEYDIAQNEEAGRAKVDYKEKEFLAKLEMADNYGWIENNESVNVIDRISADMEKRKGHYVETGNFGFYFRTMDAYISNLKKTAEQHKDTHLQRLRKLRNNAGVEQPIFAEIERLIEDQDHMYSVAEDYMSQYEKNGQTEVPQSSTLANENNDLSSFIGKYDELLKDAKASEREKLSELFGKHYREKENNQVKTGKLLLDCWPRSEGNQVATSDKLRSFFEYLGLGVEKVTPQAAGHYHVEFLQKAPSSDYPHPIGAFGSDMEKKGLNVFLLFVSQDAETMMTSIRQRITASVVGPSLILADSQMSLAERRKLAQMIKQDSQSRGEFLIMDRVMVLFLAKHPQSMRWVTFLKCALPFGVYNPYTENSSVEICPEMFIGRREELEQVLSPQGINVIYGGRQLGKTALLHRAKKLADIRQSGKWSIYLDIKKETSQSAIVRILQKLQDEHFLPPDIEAHTWNELTRILVNRIKRDDIQSFLLLLDEADNFLKDSKETDYESVDCLKRIQNETENKFKFVLAGLHNVLKFQEDAEAANSVLPHLGALTIKPLPYSEASELLEKPLAHLGFAMSKEDTPLLAQILSSTNYYPGLIQFYGSRLVRAVGTQTDTSQKPPYLLQENQILNLLKDQDFLDNIKDKFMITLGIDQNEKGYYRTLANVLAYCHFQYPEDIPNGYSAQKIIEVCKEYEIHSISDLLPKQVVVLLDELVVLNVFRKNDNDGTPTYIFNRPSFRHMLGDEEEVESALMEIMEKEQAGNER